MIEFIIPFSSHSLCYLPQSRDHVSLQRSVGIRADRKGETRIGTNTLRKPVSFVSFRCCPSYRSEWTCYDVGARTHDDGILFSANPRHSAAQCEYYGKGKMDSRIEERRVSVIPVIRGGSRHKTHFTSQYPVIVRERVRSSLFLLLVFLPSISLLPTKQQRKLQLDRRLFPAFFRRTRIYIAASRNVPGKCMGRTIKKKSHWKESRS